ncbi:hypothetical protein TREMEDRAFT_66553 [Tremella mesenterica DSM 1558]|uniref:uncharacterized protein n=1 Tax=Tremella mesenterica (strain ATCC 24925 / CBS 8224 / DSM 1558 / NBRC 9311 / NRRL Y-6157 / RJB 2259-6 / UBC 559-6) TaxID=578456 RepID=UPI00032D0B0A|nr:uncharacterized protein TREMEDRAFT_66553 [Tremella mesenterica DSM 1558]EIW65489.1 hypothetical protein TREMEDRAFT_66553 [Tremella mesenterica DSM 1558]
MLSRVVFVLVLSVESFTLLKEMKPLTIIATTIELRRVTTEQFDVLRQISRGLLTVDRVHNIVPGLIFCILYGPSALDPASLRKENNTEVLSESPEISAATTCQGLEETYQQKVYDLIADFFGTETNESIGTRVWSQAGPSSMAIRAAGPSIIDYFARLQRPGSNDWEMSSPETEGHNVKEVADKLIPSLKTFLSEKGYDPSIAIGQVPSGSDYALSDSGLTIEEE